MKSLVFFLEELSARRMLEGVLLYFSRGSKKCLNIDGQVYNLVAIDTIEG